jgi:N-acetylglucosamine-6-phosphate deacetylase
VDTSNERYFVRADRLGNEFGLPIVVRGSGREYRRLNDVVMTGRPIIVPVDFPKAPAVSTPADAATASLSSLMHWDLAPENPARLVAAGARIALTTDRLDKKSEFWKALRKAVQRGLASEDALAALTTTPADMFGVAHQIGTIQAGKAAHLVIASGDLFTDDEAKIEETWVSGQRYQIVDEPDADLVGKWQLIIVTRENDEPTILRVRGKPGKYKGSLAVGNAPKDERAEIKQARQVGSQFSFLCDGDKFDREGFISFSLVVVEPLETGTMLHGRGVWPDGKTFRCQATKLPDDPPEEDEDDEEEKDDDDDEQEDDGADAGGDSESEGAEELDEAESAEREEHESDPETSAADESEVAADDADTPENSDESKEEQQEDEEEDPRSLFEVNYPLGAYGREALPPIADRVVFTGATVWTCGPQGKLENATVMIANGRIEAVGTDIEVPAAAQVIEVAGKHISPGIIDCHSHIATDGGVNEGTQAITCEVRIGDFIDADDISIYRQLAGGVTAANILHGSANPIGGQNQVIKMRWGANGEAAKFREAPPGVKFALGENVKQSNWGGDHTTRYPQTRMGVDEIHVDAFLRAQAYRREWAVWKTQPKGLPPRYDLELEALAEIVEGTRWIHCHSYRQSEILALMKTCDRFGITIGTFQHILEGYKVADEMAKRGIMGSAFSDWWAYKFEVYDAIPFAGALMHNAGVVVSFNSDDAEMGRRLNIEAAKAMRYGGLSATDALNFVTLNPAKQLRIDDHVGSLEAGKHADLVVWSSSPLSVYAVCEQTWVDGRRMFDLDENRDLQGRDRDRHAALVQKIISTEAEQRKPGEDDKNDDDLWARSDTYCHGHDHGHDHED